MKCILKLATCLLLPLFGQAADGFVIKGKVSGVLNGTVSIVPHQHEGEEAPEVVGEKVKIVNGEFIFKGKLSHPEVLDLKVSTRLLRVFLENAEYTIEGNLQQLDGAALKGGVLNAQYHEYITAYLPPISFVRKHPTYELAAYVGSEYLRSTAELEEAWSLMTPAVQSSYYGQKLKERLDVGRKASEGHPVPNFTMKSPDGKAFSIKELQGKVTVLDFWASWCAPCREYTPTMRGYHQQYAGKGVQFVGVSFDENPAKWKAAIGEWEMPWRHGIVEGGYEGSDVRKMFNVAGIPYVVVIGKDGTIAAALDYKRKDELPGILDKLIH